MKRRIMKEFEIDEISGVDSPAQQPAVVTILKRAPTPDELVVAKQAAITTAYEGHTHLLVTATSVAGETSWAEGHSHPWTRNADGVFSIGEAQGHTHGVDEMTMTKGNPDPDNESGRPATAETETAEMTTKDDKAVTDEAVQKQIDDLTARAERAEKVADLSDAQRTLFKSLNAEEQDAFLSLDGKARDAKVAKAAEANAVVYTAQDGTEYRKSDDPRMVALAKQADEERAQRIASEDAAKVADLQKRAAEFAHLPGDEETRVAILKAIDTLDDDAKAKALESLRAQDAELAKAFERAGTSAAPSKDTDLDAISKRIREAEPTLTPEQAMAKALETPEGAEAYAKSRQA